MIRKNEEYDQMRSLMKNTTIALLAEKLQHLKMVSAPYLWEKVMDDLDQYLKDAQTKPNVSVMTAIDQFTAKIVRGEYAQS